MLNFKSYILNKLAYYTGIDPKYSEKIQTVNASKIDFLKIQELLIMQYSERILENFENELNLAYEQHRHYEITLVPHSKQHHDVIDVIKAIRKDLEIIQLERDIIKQKNTNNVNKIKQDLNISTYIIKKSK